MRFFAAALLPLVAGLAAAQDAPAAPATKDYPVQSEPFYLKLQSSDAELDGIYLASYHAGAAIEQLGSGGKDGNQEERNEYFLNSTTCAAKPLGDEAGPVGILMWYLPVQGMDVPSAMTFEVNGTSPVEHMILMPGLPEVELTVLVGFDEDDMLYSYDVATEVMAKDFFWCTTYWGSYTYQTLNRIPEGVPTPAPCEQVEVVREFATTA